MGEHDDKTNTRLDRRTVLKGAGLLGLGLASSGLWLPKSSEAAVKKGSQAAVKKGGEIKAGISQGGSSDSVVPGTYSNGFGILLSYTIHSRLTIVGADNKLQGDLAESWEGSKDAKRWTFKLRNAQFHSGDKLNARDVIASINFHRGDKSTSAAKPTVSNIATITADGDQTVVFALQNGDADFPYILTDYQLAIGKADVNGKIDWQDDGRRAGPYKLVHFEPGVRARFEKAENHWNQNAGHLLAAEVLTIADATARQNALLSGEVDVIDRPDLRTLPLLQRSPKLKVEEAPGFRFHGFTAFTDQAPFNNKDFRLALKYGIDRKALLDVALQGHGILGNDHPITPSYRFYNANIPQRNYDSDKAKFHLKKSGHDSIGISLSASIAAFAAAVDASVLYKSNLAPVGINIDIVNEPADSYWSNVWLKKPFIATDWGGRPTEDQMFSVAFKAGAPWNDTHFNNDRFEKLLVQAREQLDETKRKELYGEMQQIVHDEGGSITPIIPNNVWAFNKRVAHDENISHAWELDGWQFISRWWIAA